MNNLIPKIVNNNVMDTISCHTFYLAKDLYEQLSNLKHENGRHAAVLYMDSDFTDIKIQGGILAFNLVRENGSYIGYAEVIKNYILCILLAANLPKHNALSTRA